MGDFLPQPGHEIASFDSGRLYFTGRGSRSPSREILLKKDPLLLSTVKLPDSDLDWIAVNYASGRLKIYDPATCALMESIDVGGRLCNGVAAFSAGGGKLQYGLFMSHENGITLAVMDRRNGHTRSDPQIFLYEGTGLASIHPVDFYSGNPGKELVIRVRNAGVTQIVVLGFDMETGCWKEIVSEFLAEHIGTTLAVRGAGEKRARILIGVDSPCLPGNRSSTGLRKPGLYELLPVEGVLSGNGAISAPTFAVKAIKIIDPGSGWSGMSFLDSCAGEFSGRDGMDAAFLVQFAGQGRFAPETRVLILKHGKETMWLHATEARSLECGDLDGRAGPEILIERNDHLLGVAWKRE
jgi:hypothetical protein